MNSSKQKYVYNPAADIERIIQTKEQALKRIDQHRYARYCQEVKTEIKQLWEIYDKIDYLRDFELFMQIQEVLNKQCEAGIDIVNIKIPVTDNIVSNRIYLLDYTKQLQYE